MQTLDQAFQSDPQNKHTPRQNNDPEHRQRQRHAAKRWAVRRRLAAQILTLSTLIFSLGLYIWANQSGRLMSGRSI